MCGLVGRAMSLGLGFEVSKDNVKCNLETVPAAMTLPLLCNHRL